VNSVSLHFDRPLDEKKFEVWLENVIRLRGTDIFRMKGVLDFGVAVRFVLQGVHMLVDAAPDREWRADEPRQSQLVFIGRELDGRALRRGFEACAQ
jgi:G3E family GTPase